MFFKFLLRRLLYVAPMVLITTLVVFSLILLIPGNPALVLLGENATQEKIAQLNHELGLDQPVYVQYAHWLMRALHGDLGRSLFTGEIVSSAIGTRVGITMQLVALAMVIAILLGMFFAIVSVIRPNSWLDYVSRFIAMLGTAIPNFWVAMLLVFLFSVKMKWLPATGFVNVTDNPAGFLQNAIMPAISLGAFGAAQITRQLRSSLLEVLDTDYIRTAYAKGLGLWGVIWKHGLRNSFVPVVTTIGLLFGSLLGATVVVETLFAVPGMGQLAVSSILQRDFPMLQGVVLVMVILVLAINFITDVIYAVVDPRIEY